MLATWLYISVSNVADGAEAGVADQLRLVSGRRNADLDVTGALIFAGGHFAQKIEGPAENVALLRAAIERDPRHRDVRTLQEGETDRREFQDWTLAYAGSSTFVERQVRRIADEVRDPPADIVRNLTMLLMEFARAI